MRFVSGSYHLTATRFFWSADSRCSARSNNSILVDFFVSGGLIERVHRTQPLFWVEIVRQSLVTQYIAFNTRAYLKIYFILTFSLTSLSSNRPTPISAEPLFLAFFSLKKKEKSIFVFSFNL